MFVLCFTSENVQIRTVLFSAYFSWNNKLEFYLLLGDLYTDLLGKRTVTSIKTTFLQQAAKFQPVTVCQLSKEYGRGEYQAIIKQAIYVYIFPCWHFNNTQLSGILFSSVYCYLFYFEICNFKSINTSTYSHLSSPILCVCFLIFIFLV